MAWIVETREVGSEQGFEQEEKSSFDKISRGVAYFWSGIALLMGIYYFATYSFITGVLLGFSGIIALPQTRRLFEKQAEKQVRKHEDREVEARMTRGFVVVVAIIVWMIGAATIPPG